MSRIALKRIFIPVWAASLAVLVGLSLYPDKDMAQGNIFGIPCDLIGHCVAYAWLTFLLCLGCGNRKALMLASPAAVLLIGIGLECLQVLVPERSFAVTDLAVNAVGVFIGFVLAAGARAVFAFEERPR